MRKLPIGIQAFEKIRTDNYLYVDKTSYIYRAAQQGGHFFLSRPRRFGKSLLLATMRAFFEGKRKLFDGLIIEKLSRSDPDAWQAYPVFYFDFNRDNYAQESALEEVLDAHLHTWEAMYGVTDASTSLAIRFQNLLVRAREQTGRRCVVLVDEYDKPLLEIDGNDDREAHNKAVFKGFFSTLKSFDEYLHFVFITGVTKFSKVSIFSDLNQLRDISMTEEYEGICGITQEELTQYFAPEINTLARAQGLTRNDCLTKLASTYDGYHFHQRGSGVYNPFSLLNCFADNQFGAYWFATGTPTFLMRRLRKSAFDIRKFTDRTLYANESMLSDYRVDNPNLVPLLYQTGYLTIVDYDNRRRRYTLGFPNEEVEYGFLEGLANEYMPGTGSSEGTDIFSLEECLEKADMEGMKNGLIALFAKIPYDSNQAPFEHYFQTVIYLVFTLLGQFVHCEMHTFNGRVDCIVETIDYIYLFEFKRDESADSALTQIEDMGYALPYAADHRRLFKIGVAFDSQKRMLCDWKVSMT